MMFASLDEWMSLGVGVAVLSASTAFALFQCGKSRQQPVAAKKAALKTLDSSSKRKNRSTKTAKSVSGKSAKVKSSGKSGKKSSSRSSGSSKSKSAKEAAKKKLATAKEKVSEKVVKPVKEVAEKIKKEAEKAVKKEEPKKEDSKKRPVPEAESSSSKKAMTLSTRELRFPEAGGLMHVSMQNTTDERQAVKVKCSDNNIYRVSPVFAFVEPGQQHKIDIIRQNGAVKMDKLVLLQANAAAAKTDDARAFFGQEKVQPVAMHVVPLSAY